MGSLRYSRSWDIPLRRRPSGQGWPSSLPIPERLFLWQTCIVARLASQLRTSCRSCMLIVLLLCSAPWSCTKDTGAEASGGNSSRQHINGQETDAHIGSRSRLGSRALSLTLSTKDWGTNTRPAAIPGCYSAKTAG